MIRLGGPCSIRVMIGCNVKTIISTEEGRGLLYACTGKSSILLLLLLSAFLSQYVAIGDLLDRTFVGKKLS